MPPRRKPSKKRPRPCAAGQDFGSSTSKIALAYLHTEHVETSLGAFPEETFRIARVPLRSEAGLEDPERFNLSSNSSTQQFEFAAFIALNQQDGESELIIGRGALLKDLVIPLKTVFVWLAGIHNEEVLFGLPGGEDLRTHLEDKVLNDGVLEEAVITHLTLLRKMALREAESRYLDITTIVLSYPNYLCEQRGEPDLERRYYNLDRYRDYYLQLMRIVWVDYPDMIFEFTSEGYCASIYACEPFEDDNNTLDRASLWGQVKHMMKTQSDGRGESVEEASEQSGEGDGRAKYVNVFVVDTGASSAGFQYQEVFFDESGDLIGSQAQPILIEGTTGGSHLTNQEVRRLIEEDLKTRPEKLPSYAAELLDDYEQTKHLMDPQKNHSIHTLDGRVTINIPATALQRIFDFAFNGGIVLLEEEIDRLAERGEDFLLIFCGGSYMNAGLRRSVQARVEGCHQKALLLHPDMEIKCLFLANFDTAPRSAVACGAALSALRRPPVDDLLSGSAIGIQGTRLASNDRDVATVDVEQWDKALSADFLFSKGCETLPHIDYDLRAMGPDERIKFRLVCDPNYFPRADSGPEQNSDPVVRIDKITGLKGARGTTTLWRRLGIDGLTGHLNVAASTYDLGLNIEAGVLPPGYIRFRVLGPTAEALIVPGASLGLNETTMTIEVLCTQLRRGHEVDHDLNRKWRLTIKSDLGAKFLAVDDVQSAPQRCSGCRQHLVGSFQICRDCGHFGVCNDCFADPGLEHPAGHVFDEIVW